MTKAFSSFGVEQGCTRWLRVRAVMTTPWVSVSVCPDCFKAFFFKCNLRWTQIHFFCIHLPMRMPWEDGCAAHNHTYHICRVELLFKLVSTLHMTFPMFCWWDPTRLKHLTMSYSLHRWYGCGLTSGDGITTGQLLACVQLDIKLFLFIKIKA